MRAGAFIFNGVYSLDYGIMIQHRPQRVGAKRIFNVYKTNNRNGSFSHDQGVYEDTEIKLDCVFLNDNDINSTDAIDQLFDVGDYVDFVPYYDSEFTYKVKPAGPPVFTSSRKMGRAVTFDLTLEVQPMKFLNAGDQVYYFEKEMKFLNPTRYVSSPKITLYGNGTINLTVNDEKFTFNNVKDVVVIDSEKLTCVGGDMVGLDYPFIKGDTTLKTDAIKAEVEPRFVKRAV